MWCELDISSRNEDHGVSRVEGMGRVREGSLYTRGTIGEAEGLGLTR